MVSDSYLSAFAWFLTSLVPHQKTISEEFVPPQPRMACLLPKERPGGHMKRSLATVVTLIVLSLAALPAAAQTRTRCSTRSTSTFNGRTQSRYDTRYRGVTQYRNDAYRADANSNNVYVDANGNVVSDDRYYGRDRSVWQAHRDKIT